MLNQNIKTPAYVLDEAALERNLNNIKDVKDRSGAKIILALKGFSMFPSFHLFKPYLDGTTASGIYEAKLGQEYFGKEVHVYSPAYDDDEIEQLIPIADHIIFNSSNQLKKYAARIKKENQKIHLGLRVNPELQEVGTALYNPCAPCSRMGSIKSEISEDVFDYIDGLHFHILCESLAESSVRLIDLVEEKFGEWLGNIKWINFGGGHYINHKEYDKEKLIDRIKKFKAKHNIEVILEPGGTMVMNAGYLVTTVLDKIKNEKEILVLDTSATAHMPDVLEMPYRPNLFKLGNRSNSSDAPRNDETVFDHGAQPNEKKYNYLLGGRTCLTGDVIGEYSFDAPINIGDKLVFTCMMQYSFVKNTTFNGIPLPDLGILKKNGEYEVYRRFGYEDFKNKLG
ncbi:MAG TPA: carboxynorspermidine decarboxylase [Alphaproteobacteria bacterium]|nr:carboxynorspermidine decarboxylase [Alphaproteobacteria bacterium]